MQYAICNMQFQKSVSNEKIEKYLGQHYSISMKQADFWPE